VRPELALAYKFCVVADAEKEIQRAVILEKSGRSKHWLDHSQYGYPCHYLRIVEKDFDEEHLN
jgi:hypothetical protein